MSGNGTSKCLDFITPYKINSFVFNQLLKKYKSCLDTKMDEIFYGGVGLFIAISQQNYDFVTGNSPSRYLTLYESAILIFLFSM